jgi:hypothetical protein
MVLLLLVCILPTRGAQFTPHRGICAKFDVGEQRTDQRDVRRRPVVDGDGDQLVSTPDRGRFDAEAGGLEG